MGVCSLLSYTIYLTVLNKLQIILSKIIYVVKITTRQALCNVDHKSSKQQIISVLARILRDDLHELSKPTF